MEQAAELDRHLGVGTERTRHAEDATMAGTAAALGASFVTQNSRDLPRIRRGHPDIRVIDYREFLAEIDALPATPFPQLDAVLEFEYTCTHV